MGWFTRSFSLLLDPSEEGGGSSQEAEASEVASQFVSGDDLAGLVGEPSPAGEPVADDKPPTDDTIPEDDDAAQPAAEDSVDSDARVKTSDDSGTAGSKEPVREAHNPSAVELARKLGMTDGAIDRCNTASDLLNEISRYAQAQGAKLDDIPPSGAPAPILEPVGLPQLGLDIDALEKEGENPAVVKIARFVEQLAQYAHESNEMAAGAVKKLHDRWNPVLEASETENLRAKEDRFDAMIGGLDKSFEDVFAKGASQSIRTTSPAAYAKREKLHREFTSLLSVYPDESKAFGVALHQVHGDQVRAIERKHTQAQLTKRNGSAAARPTQKRGLPADASGRDAAVEAVQKTLDEIGVGSGQEIGTSQLTGLLEN